jgi:hypothetical protein
MSLWGIGSHSKEQLRGVIKGQKHTFNRWALAERRGRGNSLPLFFVVRT